ncbi:MAG: hypothetical protein AABX03_03945 [Nanoarchaeota archaeon]
MVRKTNGIMAKKSRRVKEQVTREQEPCLTVEDIVSIMKENRVKEISDLSLASTVRYHLRGSCIQVTNAGQKFNVYPVQDVIVYLEDC